MEHGPRVASDYFLEVKRYLHRTFLREKAFAQEVPILANCIAVAAELGDGKTVDQLRVRWPDERLISLTDKLDQATERDSRHLPSLVNHGGFAFLPT